MWSNPTNGKVRLQDGYGAGDYNAGTNEDPASVGVRVIDDYTLEMDFLVPAAYNASIAGLWVAAAQPQWIIEGDDCTEARGDKWTETGFQQSYGPYTLKEWIHDTTLTIVKNPLFPGWDAIPQRHAARHGFPLDVFQLRHAEWWQALLASYKKQLGS